jgi:uncharacterized protein (UPF0333 family)
MKKAQTSLEVLMLLGGAIIIALVVGIALKNIGTDTGNQAQNQIKCVNLECNSCKKTDSCIGAKEDGTTLFEGSSTSPPTTECTLFKSCKAK